MQVSLYDTTLRDGAQGDGISFSVEDKLRILHALDVLGIDFVEAGNPFSNPKDARFFQDIQSVKLRHTKLVAFGSTRRRDCTAAQDANCQALLEASTEFVAIFGKSDPWQTTEVLGVTPEENLDMISDTVRFLTQSGKHVFFDGEHFFEGYKRNPAYALQTLEAAMNAGAYRLVLCDTKGAMLPWDLGEIVAAVHRRFPDKVSVHCHDDIGCAVACSMEGVRNGAVEVQGTYIGIGERCGNANLSTILANLQLKMGVQCIPNDNIPLITSTARLLAEISNVRLARSMPYVGKSAFAHKGGMHVDGVNKSACSFEHIQPELVGNQRHILLSEVSGRSALVQKIQQIAPELSKSAPEVSALVDTLKRLELEGYQYEAATASFELVVLRELGRFQTFFEPVLFRIIEEQEGSTRHSATAIVKLQVGSDFEITAAEGNGPIHALDNALRRALEVFYPRLASVRLTDYKVRVMDTKATAAMVRVLIESSDGDNVWTTVGVSDDVLNASLRALADSMEYKLYLDSKKEKVLC